MVDLTRAQWRKSTYSGLNGCVEVAFVGDHVAMRDSKDRQGPVLLFSRVEWQAFLDSVKAGELEPQ
jgi:Domain of unknown function (DUF397)